LIAQNPTGDSAMTELIPLSPHGSRRLPRRNPSRLMTALSGVACTLVVASLAGCGSSSPHTAGGRRVVDHVPMGSTALTCPTRQTLTAAVGRTVTLIGQDEYMGARLCGYAMTPDSGYAAAQSGHAALDVGLERSPSLQAFGTSYLWTQAVAGQDAIGAWGDGIGYAVNTPPPSLNGTTLRQLLAAVTRSVAGRSVPPIAHVTCPSGDGASGCVPAAQS
jgi:hypothetical protein